MCLWESVRIHAVNVNRTSELGWGQETRWKVNKLCVFMRACVRACWNAPICLLTVICSRFLTWRYSVMWVRCGVSVFSAEYVYCTCVFVTKASVQKYLPTHLAHTWMYTADYFQAHKYILTQVFAVNTCPAAFTESITHIDFVSFPLLPSTRMSCGGVGACFDLLVRTPDNDVCWALWNIWRKVTKLPHLFLNILSPKIFWMVLNIFLHLI